MSPSARTPALASDGGPWSRSCTSAGSATASLSGFTSFADGLPRWCHNGWKLACASRQPMTSDITAEIGNLGNLGNLPAELNSFVGRERDLAELITMLGRVRQLTLCGPGGIGKTRLALRLATALASDYPDGAWLVDL